MFLQTVAQYNPGWGPKTMWPLVRQVPDRFPDFRVTIGKTSFRPDQSRLVCDQRYLIRGHFGLAPRIGRFKQEVLQASWPGDFWPNFHSRSNILLKIGPKVLKLTIWVISFPYLVIKKGLLKNIVMFLSPCRIFLLRVLYLKSTESSKNRSVY